MDSDADSVSTEACSAGYADEDCAELDEMDHTHFDDDDERRFQLAALPFRSHLDLELDREEESTSFHHQSLEEDLPNVPTYRIAVGQNYGARSRIIRRSTSEYLQQQQRDSERGYVISPHLHLHDEDSPEASAHLKPLIPSLHSHLHEHEGEGEEEEEEEEENDEGECEGGQNVAGTPATPPMNDLRASSFGFPTPYEFACEVVQSMRDEANADRRQETPKEEESTPCYPRDTEPSSPFREKQGKLGKKKERVKFVWQPYESFSQYNFHTMYSMKKKKKSRADNPLPAVGSALTGLMHMYQNDKGMSKLPPCYFASKIAPVELIKKREIATSSSSSSSSKGVVTGQVMELKKKEKGKCISQQQEEKQKKTKVTLRRERPSSPLQASIIPRKQSGRSTIMNAISHTSASSEDSVKAGKSRGGIVVTQRRNSRVQGGKAELMHQNQQTTSSSGGSNSSATLAKIDFKKSTSDQPSSSSSKARYDNSTNSYLHNSSLLNDSSALSGRKGVVRGLTFRQASGKWR